MTSGRRAPDMTCDETVRMSSATVLMERKFGRPILNEIGSLRVYSLQTRWLTRSVKDEAVIRRYSIFATAHHSFIGSACLSEKENRST